MNIAEARLELAFFFWLRSLRDSETTPATAGRCWVNKDKQDNQR